MFLQDIYSKLKTKQKSYNWKQTLWILANMPIETIEDRFKLLLELSCLRDSVKLSVIADWKVAIPNLYKIKKLLLQSNTMSHSTLVIWSVFKQVMQELSFEIEAALNKWETFDDILSIYTWEKEISSILSVPKSTNIYNKIYSLVWKSGKNYIWQWSMDLQNYTTIECIDIVDWLNINGEMLEIKNFLFKNEKIIKNNFTSMRLWILWFIRYYLDSSINNIKVINFIKKELKNNN